MKIIFNIILFLIVPFLSFGQGSTCATADPFCSGSGVVFPNATSGTAQSGPSYGCLSTRPNPAWYYMQIGNTGSITLTISQTSNSGNPIDVDFIIWGPFSTLNNICANSNLSSSNIVDCSYSSNAVEIATIPNAQTGQFYMVLITNFNGSAGTIDFSQTGGSGTSDCNVLYPCLAYAGNDTTICIGQSVTLGDIPAATGNGNFTYSWTPNIGVSDTTLSNPIATPAQTITYYLTMVDDSSCTATDSITVTVRNPIANAGLDDTITCQDLTVNLNGTASTPAVYSWTSIGGSIISGGTTTTPLVGQTGLYIITANEFGCLDTDTVEIFQDASLPVVQAGLDTMITCLVDTIQLSGFISGNNLQYYWTGPSIVSGDSTLTPITAGVGAYVLTAIDTVNSCQLSSTVNIYDGRTPPAVTVGSTTNITCAIQSVSLNGTGSDTGSNISYLWSTTNGNIASNTDSIIANTLTPGLYTLTVYDSLSGCFGSDNVIIGADTITQIAFAADTSLNCITLSQGGVPIYAADTILGLSFNWTTTNGNIVVGANSSSVFVSQPGTYTLIVNNSSNGCQGIDNVIVTIDTLYPVAHAGGDTVYVNCDNSLLDGSLSSTGNDISYLWTGPFVQSGSTTTTPIVNGSGNYVLMVKNTFNECVSYDTVRVVADFVAPGADAGVIDTICSDENLILNGLTVSGDSYLWTTSNGNIVSGSTTLNPIINQGGGYTLTVESTSNGCTSSSSVTIVETFVSAIISANPKTGQSPLIVDFVNLGVADSSYWNFANGVTYGDSGNVSSYTTIYTEQGTYVVTLTSFIGDCSVSRQILIEVIGLSFLDSIPNVFTPNGDGKNDVFEFVVQQNIVELNCVVFNRWGKQVAEITKPDGFWDGKNGGNPVSAGTYFYVLNAKGIDDIEYKFKGTVSIIR